MIKLFHSANIYCMQYMSACIYEFWFQPIGFEVFLNHTGVFLKKIKNMQDNNFFPQLEVCNL